MSRTDVKQWCTTHEYELLELEKNKTSETDEEDEEEEGENSHRKQKKEIRKKSDEIIVVYRDVYGIERLIQTLQLHQWSNMNLKGKRKSLQVDVIFGRCGVDRIRRVVDCD